MRRTTEAAPELSGSRGEGAVWAKQGGAFRGRQRAASGGSKRNIHAQRKAESVHVRVHRAQADTQLDGSFIARPVPVSRV